MATLSENAKAYLENHDDNAIRALESALATMRTLYECIELDGNGETETPVICVGVHPLRWGKTNQPTMAFRLYEF